MEEVVTKKSFVSRAGEKLDFALQSFDISVKDKVCLDLGSSTGGFVDCLLKRGAKKVFAIDNGYGVLDWNLRNDERVVVMERTNALHINKSGLKDFPIEFISIDVGWTLQHLILPVAYDILENGGNIVTLVKLHYEAAQFPDKSEFINRGVIYEDRAQDIADRVYGNLTDMNFEIKGMLQSPIKGKKGGNTEYLFWIQK